MALRALQRRVKRMERDAMPVRSPFVIAYGSFDNFVETEILPGIESGALDTADMVEVAAALRTWETDGTWERASGQVTGNWSSRGR